MIELAPSPFNGLRLSAWGAASAPAQKQIHPRKVGSVKGKGGGIVGVGWGGVGCGRAAPGWPYHIATVTDPLRLSECSALLDPSELLWALHNALRSFVCP